MQGAHCIYNDNCLEGISRDQLTPSAEWEHASNFV